MDGSNNINQEALEHLEKAVASNQTDELVAKQVPKSQQTPGEPDMVAVGNPTLSPPEQKVHKYTISFIQPIIDGKMPEGFKAIEGSSNECVIDLHFKGIRIPSVDRGRFLKKFSEICLMFGIVDGEGNVVADWTADTTEQVLELVAQARDIGELAIMVHGIDPAVMENADPYSLLSWFGLFILNEQNYLVEAGNFTKMRLKEAEKNLENGMTQT